MKFNHLNTFRQVAHTGSFTRAAQKLYITQPTVTQHIQMLEKELDVQLIYRSKSDTRLTPAGHTLLQNVDAIFEILDDMKASFQSDAENIRGDLSIGSTAIMCTSVLPQFIVEFVKRYKNVNFSLHCGNSYTISEWVQSGIVDFGFAPYVPGFTKLDFSFIHREKIRFAVAPDNPLASKNMLDTSDLADKHFFIREKGSRIGDVVTKWLNARTWPETPPSLVVCTDMDALKKIVEMSTGVTALPESALEREFSLGLLKEITFPGASLYVDYYLVRRQNFVLSQTAESFLELFKKMERLVLCGVQK